jgi:hypothetical protein
VNQMSLRVILPFFEHLVPSKDTVKVSRYTKTPPDLLSCLENTYKAKYTQSLEFSRKDQQIPEINNYVI